ncbi:MAG: TonB-dependent receptor [Bacteroidota bacterium]
MKKRTFLPLQVLIFLCVFTCSIDGLAQNKTQVIKGKVIDNDTHQPLVGAVVYVDGTDPRIGSIADNQGNFRLIDVPLGRQTIKCRYPGFSSYVSDNIVLTSAKERYLEIQLIEEIGESTTDEVVISATEFPTQAVNELSVVSTRSFNSDDTDRIPAAVNDPSRMALAFPGVQQGGDDAENDIIIRGNSSFGVLWRLEDVYIPNPNHFAKEGSSGGGLTVFSAQLLDRSDFSTGGFAAEYGNGLSGAFDVRFRAGNKDLRENRIKIGLLGLDFSTEGPIQKGRSSYLVNYRYSTLSILNQFGFNLVGERVDNDFQDLSFNLAFDGKDGKNFTTVWGMGGLSQEHYRPVVNPDERDPGITNHWEDRLRDSDMAAVGLTHTKLLDEKSYLKISVAGLLSNITRNFDTLDLKDIRSTYNTEQYQDRRLVGSLTYSRKFNARTRIKTGIHASHSFFTFFRKHTPRRLTSIRDEIDRISVDGQGNTQVFQAYAQLSHRATERLTLNAGAHVLLLALNKTSSIEPRISAKYRINKRQALSFAYGLHGQHLPLGTYFYVKNDTASDGNISTSMPNFNMKMIRSHHLVLGYNFTFAKNLRIGADVYFQRLFNVPVRLDPSNTSTWWFLNNQSGISQFELSSGGKGTNYGIDLILEKFFSNQLFFLLTASRFESMYEMPDGRTFNTRFATEYVSSVTLGKEFTFKKGGVLQAGFRVLYNGGFRYTPPDWDRSAAEGRFVPDLDNAWSLQVGPYNRIDTRIAYRRSLNRTAFRVSLDIQNITDRRNNRSVSYNAVENKLNFRNHNSGFIPVLSFQFDF